LILCGTCRKRSNNNSSNTRINRNRPTSHSRIRFAADCAGQRVRCRR
jgi:hypothetical protein